ncbi:MAG: T9SS type A sorting domain-containing protein [Prevotella sp.]|nr:T9SS type A sorting domain-containing protein [Prevotella sp.]
MKKTIIMSLLLLAVTSVSAKSVVMVLNDSTKVYYLIENGKPVLKMKDNGFTVNNQDTYEFETFNRFFISNEDAPTGINQLEASDLLFEGGSLLIESSQAARVYSADGKAISVPMRQVGNKQSFDLSAMPPGIYVLRCGNQSMKFMKK